MVGYELRALLDLVARLLVSKSFHS